MKLIIIVLFVMALMFFPRFRFALKHPLICCRGAFNDAYDYVKHKRKNECKEIGKVFLFTASGSKAFGSGKTLSMVRYVTLLYKRYNNLDVWDEDTKTFVKQRVIVISNIELYSIPYIPFVGREQFVNLDKLGYTNHDVVLFCIDEAGMEFNSRSYKDNLPTDFLCRLLQVRHNRCSVILSAQRASFIDKVLRQICGVVTTCDMKWRIVRLQDYDAYALENLPNPEMLQPLNTRYYFATDELFNSYDTTYNVSKLKNQLETGDLLDTEEILQRIGDNTSTVVATPKLRQRFRKRRK